MPPLRVNLTENLTGRGHIWLGIWLGASPDCIFLRGEWRSASSQAIWKIPLIFITARHVSSDVTWEGVVWGGSTSICDVSVCDTRGKSEHKSMKKKKQNMWSNDDTKITTNLSVTAAKGVSMIKGEKYATDLLCEDEQLTWASLPQKGSY